MTNQALLQEIINGHSIEVFHDDINPMDMIDPSIFEDDDLQVYLDKFKNDELAMYWISVKKLCACCNQKSEIVDSLGGIEAESPEKALDYYFTSGYAPEFLEAKLEAWTRVEV